MGSSAFRTLSCEQTAAGLFLTLLRFSPRSQQVKVWPWLAGHAKHFVRITIKGIKFGDAKGLCVDEELWHGTSEKSKTFENEPLSGDAIEFDCLSLEVWGFK